MKNGLFLAFFRDIWPWIFKFGLFSKFGLFPFAFYLLFGLFCPAEVQFSSKIGESMFQNLWKRQFLNLKLLSWFFQIQLYSKSNAGGGAARGRVERSGAQKTARVARSFRQEVAKSPKKSPTRLIGSPRHAGSDTANLSQILSNSIANSCQKHAFWNFLIFWKKFLKIF